MKAKELIRKLEKLVKKHGNAPVYFPYSDFGQEDVLDVTEINTCFEDEACTKAMFYCIDYSENK
jgi:hypothetical protein